MTLVLQESELDVWSKCPIQIQYSQYSILSIQLSRVHSMRLSVLSK